MALTIKTETSGKPKEFVLLSKWDAVFGRLQRGLPGLVPFPRCDEQPKQNFKDKEHMDVQSVSRRDDYTFGWSVTDRKLMASD